MPNVTLHFYAANDLNGDVLLEVTDEDDYLKGVELRIALDELGGGSVRLARDVGFALFQTEAVDPEVFVRVLVHAYSDTEYFWGFFLDKREQKVVGLEGTEEYHFGGPGPKQYLDRAALGIEQYTGTGWQIDLDAGVFRWQESATAGRILNRIIEEDFANPVPALPDLTKSFSATVDSDSDAWTNTVSSVDDDFELPIGQSILRDLWELEDLSDLETRIFLGTVATPVFRLDALPVLGVDYSGDHFAADILRFAEASTGANPDGNIGAEGGGVELTVRGQSLRKATHVIVKGRDGVWAVAVKSGWTAGDYVKYQTIEYSRTNNVTMLEKAGIRWLRRQEAGEAQIDVPIISGTTPVDGRYFPEPDGLLWVGNTASLWTGGVTGTPLDYRDDVFRVTGIKLDLLPASVADSSLAQAMSWQVVVQLNYERGSASSPSQGTTGAHTPGPCCGPRAPDLPGGGVCTRLYPSSDGTALTASPAQDAAWDDGAPTIRQFKMTSDGTYNATAQTSDSNGGDVAGRDIDYWRGSIAMDAGLAAIIAAGGATIRGFFPSRARSGIGISEASQDMISQVGVRVTTGDSTTIRGTAKALHTLASSAGSTKWPAQSQRVNRMFPPVAASNVLSAVAGAVAGDHLIIEMGSRNFTIVSETSGGSIKRTNSDAADMPEDESSTSDLNVWFDICTGSTGGHPPLTTVRNGEGEMGEPGRYVPVGSTVEAGFLSEDGVHYFDAVDIEYDPSTSGLEGTNAQEAIDALDALVDALPGLPSLDDLTDVTITSPVALHTLIYDSVTSEWVNTAAMWRPLMDGAGAVIVDGATGEAIMTFGP